MKFRSLLARRRHDADEIDESGFTLIELLIVVVIMGILAAVVAFAVGSFASTSAAAACNTDVKSTQTAISAYYAQNGVYPTAGITALAPNYLQTVPSNPAYTISLDGTGQNVSVALTSTDPGAAAYTGSPTTTAQDYNTFVFPAAAPTSMVGKNICAGA